MGAENQQGEQIPVDGQPPPQLSPAGVAAAAAAVAPAYSLRPCYLQGRAEEWLSTGPGTKPNIGNGRW